MAAKLKVLKGHEPNSPANYWDTQKIFKTQNSSLVHLSASTPSTVLMGQVGFFNFSLKIFKAPYAAIVLPDQGQLAKDFLPVVALAGSPLGLCGGGDRVKEMLPMNNS